jgi:hypothetical protein
MPPRRFAGRLYGAWARRSFDSLAIDHSAAAPSTLLRRARAMRKLMRRAGDPNAGLWITNFGWADRGRRGRLRTSRRRQAKRLRQTLVRLARERRRLRLGGIGYVTWRDGSAARRRSWQRRAGLLDRRGKRKPAYGSFRAAARAMR